MESLRNNKITVLLIYLNLLFLFKVMEVSYLIKGFEYGFILALMAVGTLIYWIYESVLKRGLYKFLFTAAAILGAGAYYLTKAEYVNNLIKTHLIENLYAIGDLTFEIEPTYFYQYRALFIIIIPLLVILILLMTNRGWLNSILFIILGYMLTLWFLGYTEEIKSYLLYYVFISVMTYTVNNYLKSRRQLSKRGIRVAIDHKRIAVYVLAVCILVTGAISALPQHFKGRYDSDWQTRFVNKFSKEGTKYSPASDFLYDISSSGFNSGDQKLGGPITISDQVAFRVRSDKTYYLKGIVKDFYDGFSWSITEKNFKQKDEKETNLFKDNFSLMYLSDVKKITVYPAGVRTSSFFVPEYARTVIPQKDVVFYNDIPIFLSSSTIDKSYDAEFYSLKDNIPLLSDDKYWSSIFPGGEMSRDYYKTNFGKYLQVPDNISPDIYERVYEITKGCRTSTEKVNKIKEYLAANFPYSLKVSEIPEGREFIDYFLNVEKKGYCTYFATTATIFCRIAGVPARYVEGFNMTETRESDGLYKVTNENAHAWTEVLLMAQPDNGLWVTLDCVPGGPAEVIRTNHQQQTGTDGPTNPSTNPIKKPNQNNGDDEDSTSKGENALPIWVVASAASASAVILVIVALLVLESIRKKRLMQSERIVPLYVHSLRRLKSARIIKPDNMADREFAEQISDEMLKERLCKIVQLSYEEFYGNKNGHEFDRKEYYHFIEDYVRRRKGMLRYWIQRYFRLK